MRKLRLSPLENRVMWVLEEAGEAWLTLVTTVREELPEQDESGIAAAVDHLRQLGFVREADRTFFLTEDGRRALTR